MVFFKNKSFGGFIIRNEIIALEKIVERPSKPFIALLGGVKVSDKIKIIEKLLSHVDGLLIGGAMAYPFLRAKGNDVGTSLCSDDDVTLAKSLLASKGKDKIHLPLDHVISEGPEGKGTYLPETSIPEGKMGLDIGEKTINHFQKILASASTILWNGPMGFFENEEFANGTNRIAKILSEKTQSFTFVGGGDSVSAIKKLGLSATISHISTGGGASLEYIENGTLPGIQALKFGVEL